MPKKLVWLIAPVVLLAACQSTSAADTTLALCQSALERRLAVENDQARFFGENFIAFSAVQGSEWDRLAAQHAQAEQDINTYCLLPAELLIPTVTPIPTATPTPAPIPTFTPRERRRSVVPAP